MIFLKRTIRKKIFFGKDEWTVVCKRAKFLKMKPAAFIRNMSVHQMWKDYRAEDLCLPFKKVNHIGTDLDMIIKTAEKTNSEHLEKLKELKKRFENCRRILNRYYYQLLNID